MKQYRVALTGLGPRGKIHADGFLANADRFELVGLCDLREDRLQTAAAAFKVQAVYTSTERMLAETRPDVFCFATLPDVRLSLIELGIRYGVKAIALEKPMATSLREARRITDLCAAHGIKAVVSHQQKYLTSMQKLKAFVDSGAIGEITETHATTLPFLSQLGTHFTDYALWVNGGRKAKWVVGHVHGRKYLADSHPSPDYVFGQFMLDNGKRVIIECGYLAPSHVNSFWVDNRLTVYGTHGYAWAETDGAWGAFTKNGALLSGQDEVWQIQQHRLQAPYLRQLADWLDDDSKVHPCNVDLAYHGFEILDAMCLSALENRRIDLPLADIDTDMVARMRAELPEVV